MNLRIHGIGTTVAGTEALIVEPAAGSILLDAAMAAADFEAAMLEADFDASAALYAPAANPTVAIVPAVETPWRTVR